MEDLPNNLPNDSPNDAREKLGREQVSQSASPLADRLISIGKDCAAHLEEPFRSKDHAELLYDENGLPHGN